MKQASPGRRCARRSSGCAAWITAPSGAGAEDRTRGRVAAARRSAAACRRAPRDLRVRLAGSACAACSRTISARSRACSASRRSARSSATTCARTRRAIRRCAMPARSCPASWRERPRRWRHGARFRSRPISRASNGRWSRPSTPPTRRRSRVASLAAVAPERWAELSFVFQPALQQLALGFPVDRLRIAHDRGDADAGLASSRRNRLQSASGARTSASSTARSIRSRPRRSPSRSRARASDACARPSPSGSPTRRRRRAPPRCSRAGSRTAGSPRSR